MAYKPIEFTISILEARSKIKLPVKLKVFSRNCPAASPGGFGSSSKLNEKLFIPFCFRELKYGLRYFLVSSYMNQARKIQTP